MNILGAKLTHHDTGAALMSNGRVVAIAEERLNHVKHSNNMFPHLAIQYCLDALGIKPEDVDLIVLDQVKLAENVKMKEKFLKWKKAHLFTKARIEVINHHDAHAASAFFCSPFREAAVLIYDGSGETKINQFGLPAVETEGFYYGIDNRLIWINRTTHAQINGKFPYTFGLGRLYAMFSTRYLNFGGYNEGKMMGLASYGDKSLFEKYPREMWYKEHMGYILCNAKIRYSTRNIGTVGKVKKNLNNIIPVVQFKIRQFVRKMADKFLLFAYSGSKKRFFAEPDLFPEIKLEVPARVDEKLPDSYYASVAHALQTILEEVAVKLGNQLKAIARSDNLCIAGGVGLNIDANRNFLDKVGFKHLFVQPGASDTGIPLGCVLHGLHVILGAPRQWEMKTGALGRVYSEDEILLALKKFEGKVTVRKSGNVCKETAQFMADGKIIGWFHGGAEYGPRALGNRSIICNGGVKDMKDVLNNKVKHRESWRPFAASVLEERMSEWFDIEHPSPFMLLAAKVCEDKKDKIPSLVHVDGTCRLQSVTKESNARYYELINEFYKLTGIPLLLNTSFNLGGDPIVEKPYDALDTFVRTQMDYLVLEDYIVEKVRGLNK
ncbi:MAG TPA: hypothetical protein DDW36_01180 [Candidatus Magasanikbacteria bacterium]|nr:hypothetical protein [Candidatus Magasanikbacteria bacterium]